VGYRVVFRGGTIPEPHTDPDRPRGWTRIGQRIRAWRREPRRVIGLLLLATVLIDAVALAASYAIAASHPVVSLAPPYLVTRHGEPAGALVLALLLSQVSLTAIWVAMGRSAFPVRAMLGFLALVGWAGALSLGRGPYVRFPLAGPSSGYAVTDLVLFAANILAAVAAPVVGGSGAGPTAGQRNVPTARWTPARPSRGGSSSRSSTCSG